MDTPETQPDIPMEPNTARPESASPPAPAAPQPQLAARRVEFANKNEAWLVSWPPAAAPDEIIKALELPRPNAILLLVGDAAGLAAEDEAHLVQLFSRGVARALADMNALIIDNGRESGAAAMMGRAVEDRGRKTALLGIAPAGLVTYPGQEMAPAQAVPLDSHHSHFILTDGSEWGSETGTVFKIAGQLANPRSKVMLVVGGDGTAKRQVLQTVRQGWPVIVIKGSGGLADEIANLNRRRPAFIPDSDLAEIIVDGKIYTAQLAGPISALQRLLEQVLGLQETDDEMSTLELVWQRFAQYDQNANRQQRNFSRIQLAIMVLGVVGTFLALAQVTLKNIPQVQTSAAYPIINQILFLLLLLTPITITALVAAANRFSAGNKWILLRAGAESLKKEIYRYRARVEIYSDRDTRTISRDIKLHNKEEILSRKLMQTEVNVMALTPYTGPIPPKYGAAPGDDGLSFITPERYITYRLEDQLKYYQNKTVRLEKQLVRFQWLIYLFGGVGTLLVAIQQELWLAFTTALVSALTTYMEYKKIEDTLMRYNQTAAELTSIRSWWVALSSEEQADPVNLDKLVGQTETTIHSEHAAWVQEMQDAMAELRAEKNAEKTEERNRQQPDNNPPNNP